MSNDYGQNDYKNNIKGTLEKNVTFFSNDPIGLVSQLMSSRGYNNPTSEFNDIMIVSIPKEELEQNREGIIIEKDKVKYLNPTYIQGFARVGVEKGNIDSFVENPQFIEKGQQKENVESLSIDDWKNKFEGWYECSRTTKMQKIKSNVIGFFKSILNKEKNKENEQFER